MEEGRLKVQAPGGAQRQLHAISSYPQGGAQGYSRGSSPHLTYSRLPTGQRSLRLGVPSFHPFTPGRWCVLFSQRGICVTIIFS